MMRWQRDFYLGLGFLGGIVLSMFVFPPLGAGLGMMSGFFIAKSVFHEDERELETKQE